MSTKVIINQGDTSDTYQVSPFVEGEATQTLSDGGWTCRSVVVAAVGDVPIIDNVVTTKTVDDLYFETALASPDTDTLNGGSNYLWIIEIENTTTTPKYRRELHIPLKVNKQGAPATTEVSVDFPILSVLTNTVTILAAALPSGTITRIDLKDITPAVIQTTGFVSATVNGANLDLLLTETVTGSPVTICFVT